MVKQVVLLGKGDLAIRIAEWFHAHSDYELDCVVPVVPEPTWTNSITAWCKTHGVAVVESGRYQDIRRVRVDSWHTGLALSVFYDRILPAWFIAKCGRILNLHNAPLPRYRGVAPINWALKKNRVWLRARFSLSHQAALH